MLTKKEYLRAGRRAEKEGIFLCVFPCFFRVTEKLSFKGIQHNFFYDFFNKDGKMTFKEAQSRELGTKRK